MPGLFIGGGRHQDKGLETHLTGQEAMTFPSPTTTHVKEGRLGRQPRDMLFRTRWPPGAWRSAWPHGGAPAFRLKHAAARPQVPPALPGRAGRSPGDTDRQAHAGVSTTEGGPITTYRVPGHNLL